jgi:UDP-N-acetylmuramyl pentapeptide phosphotransferase/UDP-N-acetylglucosamine-1-phosphate transferase
MIQFYYPVPVIQVIAAFVIGFILVYISIPVIVRISEMKNLTDEPSDRRINKTVVPNLGGVAIFIGISIATLLSLHQFEFIEFRYIQAALIILFFIGIKDDILVIAPDKKFMAQILCALILIVFGDIRFTNLHWIFGVYHINFFWSLIITVTAIVAIINSINLVDGIDGLAASIGVYASVIFGTKFLITGNSAYGVLCGAVAGSLIAFLWFNLFGGKYKIFLGDTGSLILGLLIAVMAIQYNEFALSFPSQERAFSPIFSLAILATPLADMIRVFTLRIMKGKSPFAPDLNHIHHRLLRLGYSHLQSTLIILVFNGVIIILAFAFRFLNKHLLMGLLILVIFFLLQLPDILLKRRALRQDIQL